MVVGAYRCNNPRAAFFFRGGEYLADLPKEV